MLCIQNLGRSFAGLVLASLSLGLRADDSLTKISAMNKTIEEAHQKEAAKLNEAFTPGEDQAVQKFVIENPGSESSVRTVIYPGSLEDTREAKIQKQDNLRTAIDALERTARLDFDGERLKGDSSDGETDDVEGRQTDQFKGALQSFFRNAAASAAPVSDLSNFRCEIDESKVKKGPFVGLDAYKLSYDLPNGDTVVLVPDGNGTYKREHYRGGKLVRRGAFGINKDTMKIIATWVQAHGQTQAANASGAKAYALASISASGSFDNRFSSYDVKQPKHSNNPSIASTPVTTFSAFKIVSLPKVIPPKVKPQPPAGDNGGGRREDDSREKPDHPDLSEQRGI